MKSFEQSYVFFNFFSVFTFLKNGLYFEHVGKPGPAAPQRLPIPMFRCPKTKVWDFIEIKGLFIKSSAARFFQPIAFWSRVVFLTIFWGGPGPGQLAQHIRQKKNPKFATVLKSRQNQRTFFLHGLKQKLDRFFNASKQLYKKWSTPDKKNRTFAHAKKWEF